MYIYNCPVYILMFMWNYFVAGLSVPQVDVPAISACFMLSNMFDPSTEMETGWDSDIKDDVLDECNKFGDVLHIHVDISSPQVSVACH